MIWHYTAFSSVASYWAAPVQFVSLQWKNLSACNLTSQPADLQKSPMSTFQLLLRDKFSNEPPCEDWFIWDNLDLHWLILGSVSNKHMTILILSMIVTRLCLLWVRLLVSQFSPFLCLCPNWAIPTCVAISPGPWYASFFAPTRSFVYNTYFTLTTHSLLIYNTCVVNVWHVISYITTRILHLQQHDNTNIPLL